MQLLNHRSLLAAPLVAALVALAALPAAEVISAQAASQIAPARPVSEPARVPFGPGETARYKVTLGAVTVGEGAMEILGTANVRGAETYHAQLRLKGGLPLARVDDTFQSWIDVEGLFSRRFKQDQKEIRFERKRTYDFFPERKLWRRENGRLGPLPTDQPLDDVSFLYYARTLPLEVGQTYTIPRYFKDDGNPVVLKVLRKERVRVPAGTFNTVVVRPIIQTDGLFGEGGEAEVYFTDDDRRIMVMMRSKVPIVGSLNLYLKDYQPGRPLAAAGS